MTGGATVLFVGDDASSTQIAETLLRRLTGNQVEIRTAGAQPPDPGGRADQLLVMMGLDPAHEERLSVRALNTSDRVVVLGTGLDVARVPGRTYDEWDVENESLEEHVRALAIELLAPSHDAEQRRAGRLPVLARRLGAVAASVLSRVRRLPSSARTTRVRVSSRRRRR